MFDHGVRSAGLRRCGAADASQYLKGTVVGESEPAALALRWRRYAARTAYAEAYISVKELVACISQHCKILDFSALRIHFQAQRHAVFAGCNCKPAFSLKICDFIIHH